MIYCFTNVPENWFIEIFDYLGRDHYLSLHDFRFLTSGVTFKLRLEESDPMWSDRLTHFINKFRLVKNLYVAPDTKFPKGRVLEITPAPEESFQSQELSIEEKLELLQYDLALHIECEEYEICHQIKQKMRLLTQKKTA